MIYYNEIDPYCVQWLHNLGAANHIAPGCVDARSVKDVRSDLSAFVQAHFFAGIGLWSYALRAAGWPDDRPVWTGSCPCQPFSGAGKGEAFSDPRHLWPDWFRLIAANTPEFIFGEQVAHPDGYAWLDLVQTDLENAGYTFGSVISPAAGFGAPHGRHRIYFMAHAPGGELAGRPEQSARQELSAAARSGAAGAVADANSGGSPARQRDAQALGHRNATAANSGLGPLGHAEGERHGSRDVEPVAWRGQQPTGSPSRAHVEWLPCTDGKWRPTEPGLFPLAHGYPDRVGKLRAYGNALFAPQAIEFIKAAMEAVPLDTS